MPFSMLFGFIKNLSPHTWMLIGALVISGSAYGYHKYTVKKMENVSIDLQEEIDNLERKNGELMLVNDKYELANQEQSETIRRLREEADASEEVRVQLALDIQAAKDKYKKLLTSTKSFKDGTISPRLLAILNSINGKEVEKK